jgi:beta-galactosidase
MVAVGLLCERLRLAGAETIAVYTDDFYAGEPALTVNTFGQGRAYYLATRPDANGLRALLAAICKEHGIVSPLADGAAPSDGVEVTVRVSPGGETLLYLLNHNTEPQQVRLPDGTHTDLLTGETFTSAVPLAGRAVRITVTMGG